MLDGEGGACVWGKLLPAESSLRIGGLPIGLASRVKLLRDVPAERVLTWDDVAADEADAAYRYRQAMESVLAGAGGTDRPDACRSGPGFPPP